MFILFKAINYYYYYYYYYKFSFSLILAAQQTYNE